MSIELCGTSRFLGKVASLLVRSNLEYCGTIWDLYFRTDINKLNQIQRRAARFVQKDYGYQSSVTDMLRELGWDSLESRTEARLTLFHKIVYGGVKVDPTDYLIPGDSRTRRNNELSYTQIQAQTTSFANSFFVRTIPEWNKLPNDIVYIQDTVKFRDSLHKLD